MAGRAASRRVAIMLAARAALEPAGALEGIRAGAIEILENANEAHTGFRVSSRYVIATLRGER